MTSSDKKPSEARARFIDAAREAGADMSKEEFARVIGGLVKPKAPAKEANEDQAADE